MDELQILSYNWMLLSNQLCIKKREAKENNNRMANNANSTLETKAVEYLISLTEKGDELSEEEEITTVKLSNTGTECFKNSQHNSRPQSIRHISKKCIVIDHIHLKPKIKGHPIVIPTAYPTQYQRGYNFREFATALHKYRTTKGIWWKGDGLNLKDEDSIKCLKLMRKSTTQNVGGDRQFMHQINYNEIKIDQPFKIRVKRSVSLQEQRKGRLLPIHSKL